MTEHGSEIAGPMRDRARAWAETDIDAVFADILERIRRAPVLADPFPHIQVMDVFPPRYYTALLDYISANGIFVPAMYPGVAVDLQAVNFHDHGFICANFADARGLAPVCRVLRSEPFARALLDKFSDSQTGCASAIPPEKHKYFCGGASDFTTVADLYRDLPGYEISPHADEPTKIVTFLLYFTPDASLRQFGTMLCRPKAASDPSEHHRAAPTGGLLKKLIKRYFGIYGFFQRDYWHPWERFDIVKTAEAVPNSFFAFAPNQDSFHAVRMNLPADSALQERLNVRGFVRAGRNASNYTTPYTNRRQRKIAFWLARRLARAKRSH